MGQFFFTAAALSLLAAVALGVAAVPDSSSAQLANHCYCAFADGCGAPCTNYTTATECASSTAATGCVWRDTATQNALANHTLEFGAPHIYTVAAGVHVAVGFGLANSVLVEGPDGAFVVDTLESYKAATAVRAAFDALLAPTGKRIVALVYTHGHTDHVYGAAAFVNEQHAVDVYAHRSLPDTVRDGSLVTGAVYQRSQRQFGTYLETGPDGHLNSGIGPGLAYDNSSLLGYVRPTILYDERLDTRIAGLDVTLLHTPGETSDHTFVYLPHVRVGLAGDNIYKAFPNLYSIRGTRARSVRTWFQSLDRILDFDVDVLVLSHTTPIVGADAVRSVVRTYRDGIQYVHDQTLRLMNLGFSTEEIIDKVHLPEYLAGHPYLQEFYGTVPWGVQAVVDYYIGWFEGRASKLNPLPWREQAKRMVELAGGPDAAAAKARTAFDEGTVASWQWALQLSEAVLYDRPDHVEARRIAVASTRLLGFQQLSANGRNYYLSEAARLNGAKEYDVSDRQLLASFVILPVDSFMYSLPVLLDTRASDAVDDLAAAIELVDDRLYTVRVRRQVAELRDYPLGTLLAEPVHLHVTTAAPVFKTMILEPASTPAFLAKGDLRLLPDAADGGLDLLHQFASLFQLPQLRRGGDA